MSGFRHLWWRVQLSIFRWLGLLEEESPVDWDYVERKIIEELARSVSTCWISLNTSDPIDNPSAEISCKGYTRQEAHFEDDNDGARANINELNWNALNTKAQMNVCYVGVHSKQRKGDLLLAAPLSCARVFEQNDIPRFKAGSLVLKWK